MARFNSIEDFYKEHPNARIRDNKTAPNIEKLVNQGKPKKKKKPIARPPKMPTNAGFSWGKKSEEPESFDVSKNLLPSLLAEGDSIKIVLPYPPGTNNLFNDFIHNQTGRKTRAPTERYQLWKKAARKVLDKSKRMVLRGNIGIRMKFYRPQKSGDWDGFIKAPQDILHDWFFINDSQIVEGHIYRYDDANNPRVEIEIWEIY